MRRPAGRGAKGERYGGEAPGSGREALAPRHPRNLGRIAMFDDTSVSSHDGTLSAGDPAELDTDALPSFPDPGALLAAAGLPAGAGADG